jgi:hypothetical protein
VDAVDTNTGGVDGVSGPFAANTQAWLTLNADFGSGPQAMTDASG